MDGEAKILNCVESTAIEPFRKGLDPFSILYIMISDYKQPAFDEVLAMANQDIKIEEDLPNYYAERQIQWKNQNV